MPGWPAAGRGPTGSARGQPRRNTGHARFQASSRTGHNDLRSGNSAGPGEGLRMSDSEFRPGLEGVIAFESGNAEPDKEGGALRYRGVNINDLVGRVSYGHVWGLLGVNEFHPGLPPAGPFPLPVHTGDVRVDVQSALAQLAPVWGFRPMLDIDAEQVREDLSLIHISEPTRLGMISYA